MASERLTCKKPKGCGRRFSRPLGSRRIYCEACSPPRKPPLSERAPDDGPEVNERLIEAARGELEAAGKLHTTDGLVLLELVERIASRRVSAMGLAQLAKAYAEQRALVFVDEEDDEDVIGQLFRADA
jgi:hypothetical protein